MAFIEQRLESGTAAADRWWYGWYAGYSALTVGQFVIALNVTDSKARADYAVGAAASSLGVIPLAFVSFTPRFAAADLRVYPAATPSSGAASSPPPSACSTPRPTSSPGPLLDHACPRPQRLAGDGAGARLGYHSPRGAMVNSLGGVVLTELQAFTQPTAAIDAWRAYELGQIASPTTATNKPRWMIVPQGMGLGFAAVF